MNFCLLGSGWLHPEFKKATAIANTIAISDPIYRVSKWTAQMHSDEIFQLIDSILPFEVCVYHQVLPLSLKGSRLTLGMVDPDDTAAVDYVRRILGYVNCSLVPKQIAADNHQSMLSAYLNYTHTAKSTPKNPPVSSAASASPEGNASPVSLPVKSTLVLNRSEERVAAATEVAGTSINQPKESPPLTSRKVSVLKVQAQHVDSPVDVLANLPPKQLLQELLGRLLKGGIGRLYFERQPQAGRILWSQNGVVQSVVEGLKIAVFQGAIEELKLLTNLPLMPVLQPKQVEIERRYQQTDLLLRLRVMPGTHGEEATLQVLRGAALKFYQQQKLVDLSQDALRLAQQLQNKVDELRDRAGCLPTGQLEALPALNDLVRKVEEQLTALRTLEEKKE